MIVTPILGLCNCSMFCCAVLCVHSSFAIITAIVGFCNCSTICCALLCAHSIFEIILIGRERERELVAFLSLSSQCLMIVVWLSLTAPRVCLQFVVVVFPDHSLHELRRATYKDIHVFEDIQRDCFV